MARHTGTPRWLTATLALLCLSVFINYVDRGNLSTAAPLIKDDLHLTATQLGLLLTSFFMTYAAGHFFAGWFVDRFEAYRVLLVGFVIWSLATMLTGLAQGFATLFALRLLLGGGESVAFPAYSRVICRCFAEGQRGAANGAILASMAFGPAFGIFCGGILMAAFGWRAFFIVFGLVSFVWTLPWLALGKRCSTAVLPTAGTGPNLRAMLSTPALWGTVVGGLGGVYTWYFVLTWIPFYLVRERHWSMNEMAFIGGGAYLLTAVSMMSSGPLADRWICSGASPTLARKLFMGVGLIGCAGFMVGCALSTTVASVAFLMLAGIAYGMVVPNAFASVQTLAGPEATGRWVGIWNGLASMSGVIAPTLTGVLVDRTGNFVLPFLVAAGMATVGALAWTFCVGSIAQVDWSRTAAVASLAPSVSSRV